MVMGATRLQEFLLATSPTLERALSPEVEAMLAVLVATLALIAGQAMKILDPEVKNPRQRDVGEGAAPDGLDAVAQGGGDANDGKARDGVGGAAEPVHRLANGWQREVLCHWR